MRRRHRVKGPRRFSFTLDRFLLKAYCPACGPAKPCLDCGDLSPLFNRLAEIHESGDESPQSKRHAREESLVLVLR